MNWRDKAKEIYFKDTSLSDRAYKAYYNSGIVNKLVDIMIEFAKLACEEQKEICSEYAKVKPINSNTSLIWNPDNLDKDSILNCPTVNFDEE